MDDLTGALDRAFAHQRQWYACGDVTDAEEAIRGWQAALDVPGGDWAAANCGVLLVERAYRRRDPADAVEAARLLESSATAAGDDPVAAQRWYQLGNAHLARWRLGERPGSLQAILRCQETALRHDPADPELLLLIHTSRLMAACELFDPDDDAAQVTVAGLSGVIADAMAVLDRPAVPPHRRGNLAALLALAVQRIGPYQPGGMDVPVVYDLLARTEGVDLDPAIAPLIGVVRAYAGLMASDGPTARDTDRGLADLVAAIPEAAPGQREGLEFGVAALLAGRTLHYGDLRSRDAVLELLRREGASDDERSHAAVIDALLRLQAGDVEGARAALDPVNRRMADPSTSPLDSMLAGLAGLVLQVAGGPEAPPPPPDTPRGSADALARLLGLQSALPAALRRGDVAELRRIAADSAGLLDHITATFGQARILVLDIAGSILSEVVRLDPADRAAARRAAGYFAEARALAGGPEHPQWARLSMRHAVVLRAGGDANPAGRRALGRSALQGRAWRVLVQSGTDHAMAAVGGAADDANTVARWCVEDAAAGDAAALDDLVAVLDAGRGLVLQAATASRSVADQLVADGHTELAAEWRAAGGAGRAGLPDDLRLRVLHALHPGGVEVSRFLGTVQVPDIRTALGAVGADALVYLVAGDRDRPGFAVVVPVSGAVEVRNLPGLTAPPSGPVVPGRLPGRDLRPVGGTDGLDAVCRWAWAVCVRSLLDIARRWHLRRPARLVLVPTGPLGAVPWHAACTGDGPRRRYAVRDLVVSYAVSARTFCESARHPVRRPASALLVGDPTGDLRFAGVEASAIHAAFHPAGTYLDRATPDDVLHWLATDRGGGASMVHLACHGVIDPDRPADAHLVLAGGTLTVRRLLDATRLAGLQLDQVFLAACTTSATGAQHDEVISLATTFLAAGARTVFGSLWTVPDEATSLLMYMVHRFLADGRVPADALHAAQLWMLDPARRPAPEMPAELAALCDRAAIAEPRAWAAFTHLGR